MERRKFLRFAAELDVEYRMLGKRLAEGNAISRNLSRDGIGIMANQAFPQSGDVELKVNIPGDNVPIFATGNIVWVRTVKSNKSAADVGIRFVKIDGFDRSRILEFVYDKWLSTIKKAR